MFFGILAPKFIHSPTGTPTEVLLNYVVVEKDEAEEDVMIHQSVFNGHREFLLLGKYWVIELKVHLYKMPLEEAKTYHQVIKQFEGLEVRYYRHRDGDYLKDNLGAEVPMYIEKIDESYYKTSDYEDLLFIRFRSIGYVDLKQGL